MFPVRKELHYIISAPVVKCALFAALLQHTCEAHHKLA